MPSTPTITWDRWAVPTITADDDNGAVYGLGYAQAVAHAREVLELYGKARGTAAALWGPAFVESDTLFAQLGLSDAAETWWAGQEPATVEKLEAFAAGFNAACSENGDRGGDRRDLLPVSARDVLAHTMRVFVNFGSIDPKGLAFSPNAFRTAGSNAWAIAAERSATGSALLCINPHLAWSGYHRFFQARTVSPGRSFDGIMLIGIPWHNMGWSPDVGWAHTVNRIPVLTVYELQVEDGTYLYGGDPRPFELTREHKLEVLGEEPKTVLERRTVHGPVVTAPDGAEVAVRIGGILDQPAVTCLEGWWQMSLARTVGELVAAVEDRPLPMYNAIAADRAGSVGALSCGTPPILHGGFADSERRLPGDDPAVLWSEVHPQTTMPRVINPAGGWVQNVNDPPWFFCEPAPDPADFAGGIAYDEPDELRSIVSRAWLRSHENISAHDLMSLKFSTHSVLADSVLDELCDAAEGTAALTEAVATLRAWDRSAERDSKGYPLFFLFGALSIATAATTGTPFLKPPVAPGELQQGLLDPAASVEVLAQAVGLFALVGTPLDSSPGSIVTMTDGVETVAGSGGGGMDGILKTLIALPAPGTWDGAFGDTYIALVQFQPEGDPIADDLLVYGNTTEPSAPPRESEIVLFGESRLRRQ